MSDWTHDLEDTRKLAETGDANAQFNLGRIYYNGIYYSGEGFPYDYAQAVTWWRKAAYQGHLEAQNCLQFFDNDGADAYWPKKDVKGVKWWRKAADQGKAEAQSKLGWMYYNGNGVPKTMRLAVRWWRKAADQGDAVAQYNLGVMYCDGDGVAEDHEEAVKWFRKAADHGHAQAQYELAEMYFYGLGVPNDREEAAKWCRKAVDQARPARAKVDLRSMLCEFIYYDGSERELEDEKMFVIGYRKAADQGLAEAQFNLGLMYYNNIGSRFVPGDIGMDYADLTEDPAEAVRWWRKAADQGHAKAQYNLGYMYYNGEGVPEDDAEAARCWHKAADQGDALAQYNLGVMYRYGYGVPKDHEEAYVWSKLAVMSVSANVSEVASEPDDEVIHTFADIQVLERISHFVEFAGHRSASCAGLFPLPLQRHRQAIPKLDKFEMILTPEQLARAQQRSTELHKEIEERKKAAGK